MRITARPKGVFKAAALCAAFLSVSGTALGAGLSVGIDMSKPVRLPRDAASIIVGNPSIADIYVQSGQLVFLQGRSFGTTNLIALDATGAEILNLPVTVTSGHGQTVTLERGVSGRISYACSGRCEPMIMPGDAPEQVKMLMDETSSKTGAADQVATSVTQSGR